MTKEEQDFSKKTIIVVRKDLEPWQITNTVAHIAAYLGHSMDKSFDTGENFHTKDDIKYPRNSQYPFIIKRAKSNEQLKNLLGKVRDADVVWHTFIREMVDYTDDTKLQSELGVKYDENVECLGVGVWGNEDTVATLTKKFGLWE